MATHAFTIYANAPKCYYAVRNESGADKNTVYSSVHNAATAEGHLGNEDGIIAQTAEAVGENWYIEIYRTFMYFNTQLIKTGAPIDSVKLYIKMSYLPPTNFVTQVQRGTNLDGDGVPIVHHIPFQNSDYNYAGISGNGGTVNTSAFANTETYYPITFDATGRGWITKGENAVTKFILRHQGDVNASVPSDNNQYLWFYLSTAGKRPYLVVEVTLSVPTAVTYDATNIGATNARLNGEIINNGYWIDNYGFEWKKGAGGSISSVTVGGSGNQGISTFNYDKTGLDSGATYYYRAWGNNGAGKGYGEWKEFTTGTGVTTDSISVPDPVANASYEFGEGTGTVTGSNITERGFEVEHSFSGSLYSYIEHRIAGFDGNVSLNMTVWEGTLTKTETETGSFSQGSFTIYLGKWPAHFSDKLFAGESYKGRAYAIIEGTKYYGDWMNFSLGNFPAGVKPDDQVPIEIFVPSDGEEPIDLEDGFAEGLLEEEEFVPEDFEFPEFEYPDTPPYNGSWLGWYYYRKAYTKKDLDELRRKCRRFQDNTTEFALVINHNVKVMQQFLNMMTEYMGKDEFNTFKHIIPTQHLNTLAHRPLDVGDFKKIINEFISNSIDNANNVNNNFELMRSGFEDYTYDDEGEFKDVTVRTKLIDDENPDVERLKKVIDALNKETRTNYEVINHNLEVTRAILIGGQ